jgi:hypothetical protein
MKCGGREYGVERSAQTRPQRGTGPKKGQALFDMPTDTVVLDRMDGMRNEEISKTKKQSNKTQKSC